MTDDSIEAKALALMNEVNVERGYTPYSKFDRDFDHTSEALCRAIEQHEAFKQEVSDGCTWILEYSNMQNIREHLSRFIIPKPKPDPLVEVLDDISGASLVDADELRAALDARGLEIREKNDG
jgi:hypothetical protein